MSNEIKDELDDIITVTSKENYFLGLLSKEFFIKVAVVLMFGLYFGDLIYGKTSYSVLKNLKKSKAELSNKKKNLKSHNEKLQKKYFELKELSTGMEEIK